MNSVFLSALTKAGFKAGDVHKIESALSEAGLTVVQAAGDGSFLKDSSFDPRKSYQMPGSN